MKTQLASTDEARTLVRWLTPLFYLQIAQFVLGYMGKDTVLAVLPWLRYPASVLSALCGAGITVCLWMCAPVLDRYQKAAIFTGLGVFDKIASHAGAGTLVPITGFANAVCSPAIDSKAEGYVLGVGAKMFVIAGPVIVYGTLCSVIWGIIYYFAFYLPNLC